MYSTCSTQREWNSHYEACKQTGTPFVCIKKYVTYAMVGYDMLPVELAGLTMEAREEVRKLFADASEEAENNPKHKQDLPSFSWGGQSGFIRKILYTEAEAVADGLVQVVFDVDNWTNYDNPFRPQYWTYPESED